MDLLSEDKVVTDVVFVSSMNSKPEGYTAIVNTYGKRNAQLYETGIGKKGSSYLCYNKEVARDYDYVVEDMYIHENKEEPPKEGYEIIQYTLDGNKSMRHVKLGIKKVPRYKAKSIILDINIYLNKDKSRIPDEYVVLPKVNGLWITYFSVPTSESSEESSEGSQSSVVETTPQSSTMKEKGKGLLKRITSLRGFKKSPSPITDIAFVTSLRNVPKGYTAIKKCESGEPAQLWFNLPKDIPRSIYMCYTKKKQSDDNIINQIYMLGVTDNFSKCLSEKYEIVRETVEGEKTLKWKHLAVKKVAKSAATDAIVDIKIVHCDDALTLPKNYIAVNWSVNNCLICFKSVQQDIKGKGGNIFKKKFDFDRKNKLKF